MVSFKGHFDGKVIVPEEPVNLPINQSVRITVQETPPTPALTDLDQWLELGKRGTDNPNRRFNSDDDLWE